MSFDPACDQDGLAIAMREILEDDLARAAIDRQMAGADQRTRARMLDQLPRRTLSPAYYRIAAHLFRIEERQKAGITFLAADLANWEADGLVTVHRARVDFGYAHPTCSACGVRQANRYVIECGACRAKFRKGK